MNVNLDKEDLIALIRGAEIDSNMMRKSFIDSKYLIPLTADANPITGKGYVFNVVRLLQLHDTELLSMYIAIKTYNHAFLAVWNTPRPDRSADKLVDAICNIVIDEAMLKRYSWIKYLPYSINESKWDIQYMLKDMPYLDLLEVYTLLCGEKDDRDE